MERELVTLFARKKMRLTTPRMTVFKTLQTSKAPLSIAEITRRCPDIDRVSVYRTISTFTHLGIVKTVTLGWKNQYELADPFKSHHHHLSCMGCGRLIDLQSYKVEHLVTTVANEYDFAITDHTFEIRGLCSKCR